jgi:hypothetical protein
MPTYLKNANIDLSKVNDVKLNLKLKVDCPTCSAEMIHDFKAEPLSYPVENQLQPLNFSCPACVKQFHVPARIQNIRMILAYDPKKIKELP